MIATGRHGQEFERCFPDMPEAFALAFCTELKRLPCFRRAREDLAYGTLGMPEIYEPTVILGGEELWISEKARIDSFCKIEAGEGMTIADYVHIASYAHIGIGGGVTILEAGTSFASGSKVISGSNVPAAGRSCSAIAPGNRVDKRFAWIQRDAVLFAGAIVCPGVTVGAGAVIGAGAVVLEDVPAGEIWAGTPARKIGEVE